jgi:hypothetical protein
MQISKVEVTLVPFNEGSYHNGSEKFKALFFAEHKTTWQQRDF